MKYYLVIFCLFSYSIGWAQRLEEESTPWQSGQEVYLELKYANTIEIKTWDRDELSVRASVTINDNTQNDVWSMTTENTATQIRVISDIEEPQTLYEGDCEGRNYHVNGRSYCSFIVYEVFVPAKAPLHVETLGGDITIQGAQAPVYAKSLSGFVDVDWPGQQGATVTMKSITGEVYSNLELALDDSSRRERHRSSPVGWEIEGTVAGGGIKVQLESISNDIYFRRAGS
uniref:Adhesin domain-containing protein n=1 Tax=Roseihalotalea indica TaxID=2867963 RepID=A0AA49JG35_9BACT|nr:hypothetical protein K4G66_25945 [Tunicatimonas sp. TK19036]